NINTLSANPQLQAQGFDFGGLIKSAIAALQAGPNAQNINTLSASPQLQTQSFLGNLIGNKPQIFIPTVQSLL
ncbi:hypothetical protein, partial [Bacillus cereus]